MSSIKEELKEIGDNIGRTELGIIAEKTGVVSTSELRYLNEPARHKLLEII